LDSISFENSTSIAKSFLPLKTSEEKPELVKAIDEKSKDLNIPIIGITGTGGAGKSSLTDELVRRFLRSNTDKKIAIISSTLQKENRRCTFGRQNPYERDQ
jgi:methylmalonyl-CoA mutase